eukprot:TRINITY_DN5694_c1_g1_i3.p1 TRINITY_DN5694_c1_g1~~TRINITY_DN5694_c1_g1_i3.p1  ORF type:complete len:627 (+),score=138.62 TRINITY_DN5694_c1_g1_i3:81-1883(+)
MSEAGNLNVLLPVDLLRRTKGRRKRRSTFRSHRHSTSSLADVSPGVVAFSPSSPDAALALWKEEEQVSKQMEEAAASRLAFSMTSDNRKKGWFAPSSITTATAPLLEETEFERAGALRLQYIGGKKVMVRQAQLGALRRLLAPRPAPHPAPALAAAAAPGPQPPRLQAPSTRPRTMLDIDAAPDRPPARLLRRARSAQPPVAAFPPPPGVSAVPPAAAPAALGVDDEDRRPGTAPDPARAASPAAPPPPLSPAPAAARGFVPKRRVLPGGVLPPAGRPPAAAHAPAAAAAAAPPPPTSPAGVTTPTGRRDKAILQQLQQQQPLRVQQNPRMGSPTSPLRGAPRRRAGSTLVPVEPKDSGSDDSFGTVEDLMPSASAPPPRKKQRPLPRPRQLLAVRACPGWARPESRQKRARPRPAPRAAGSGDSDSDDGGILPSVRGPEQEAFAAAVRRCGTAQPFAGVTAGAQAWLSLRRGGPRRKGQRRGPGSRSPSRCGSPRTSTRAPSRRSTRTAASGGRESAETAVDEVIGRVHNVRRGSGDRVTRTMSGFALLRDMWRLRRSKRARDRQLEADVAEEVKMFRIVCGSLPRPAGWRRAPDPAPA